MTTTQPHIVYLIHNDAYADTRVLKYAATAAKAGLRVTLLAVSDSGQHRESWVGNAHVIRVPVFSAFETGGPPATWKSRLMRTVGYRDKERGARAVLRSQLRLLDHQSRLARTAARGESRSVPGSVSDRAVEEYLRTRLRASAARRRLSQGWLFRRPGGDGTDRAAEYDVGSIPGVRWRSHFPWLRDLEIAFAPVLDSLDADIIHVHDVYLMGTGVNAAWRARARGRDVRLVYDAREYVPGLAIQHPIEVCASADHEAEYIREFDEVLAVSEPIAEALQRKFELPRLPDMAYNVPLHADVDVDCHTVRDATGLGPDEKILVYSGGLHPTRGNHTIVEAVSAVEDLHLVVVARTRGNGYVQRLERLAASLGMAERFHVVEFVAPDQVVHYLSGADLAIHSLVAGPLNHEWALPNKLFEYLFAGLPIVVSDCRCMKEFVEGNELGLSYRSEDPIDLARVLEKVLLDLPRYRNPERRRALIEGEYSWQRQAERILASYQRILGSRWTAPTGDLEPTELVERPYPPRVGEPADRITQRRPA